MKSSTKNSKFIALALLVATATGIASRRIQPVVRLGPAATEQPVVVLSLLDMGSP